MAYRETVARQFYEWESRCRGWTVWPSAVDLEPPFEPLELGIQTRLPDDGRRPGAIAGLLSRLFAAPVPRLSREPPSSFSREPRPANPEGPLTEIALVQPPDQTTDPATLRQFVLSCRHLIPPMSFEFIGTDRTIRCQFVCRQGDTPQLMGLLSGHLPSASLHFSRSWLSEHWEHGQSSRIVVEFGESVEFVLPLTTATDFNVDPLMASAAVLGRLAPQELGVVQVLFQAAQSPWAREVLSLLGDSGGESWFQDTPHIEALARRKLASPLFATVIRIATKASSEGRAREIARSLGAALGHSTNPAGNELVPLENHDYPDQAHFEDVILRRSRRSGMLLNVDELLTFVHPPSAAVREERLERQVRRTRAAASVALGHDLVLGINEHLGKSEIVSQNLSQRQRHTYVIGASGTGKSTLLLNMILQDVNAGNGCALLDPHGDLADQVMDRIPDERLDDVALLDASDEAYPVAFNVLQAHSESEKNLLASDLVEAFKRLSTTWGDQMTSVLGNAILAFLESSRGGTLSDLRRFLVEPEYREQFLQSVRDPEVLYYWRKEFGLLTGRPQAPLLTRLDTFLRPKLIRAMVSQHHDRLNFRWLMDSRKIFIAKLTQGAIGEVNSHLLGTLLVTKFHQAAVGRQNVGESGRVPFFLYIDEFHNFITPSIASILSGARKFGLGLILSHQDLRQISGQDPDVASAVIANPYTRVCFRLGDDDAKRLQSGFASFDAKDLQSLGVGEAIVRMERAEHDFTLVTGAMPARPFDANERRRRIVALSRERYARKRDAEGEAESSPGPATPKNKKQPSRFGPPGKS